MEDINKVLANNPTDATQAALMTAFDATEITEDEEVVIMFSCTSDASLAGEWLPNKPTLAKMEVLAIETLDNRTGSPLVTKNGNSYINIKLRATDVTNSHNYRITFEKIYDNSAKRAYVITKALGVEFASFAKFNVAKLLNKTGYAEIEVQPYTSNDGMPKHKAVISKWLINFDASTLPAEQEELPF